MTIAVETRDIHLSFGQTEALRGAMLRFATRTGEKVVLTAG